MGLSAYRFLSRALAGAPRLPGCLWVATVSALVAVTLTACSDSTDAEARALQTTRCISDVSAAQRHVFECDGVRFDVMLTQQCIDAACGVIVDAHGFLSNPVQQEQRSNLASIAAQRGGYIVIQPGELSEPSSWVPEVHYPIVADFLLQALDAYAVDRDRVHFTGFSQGALMTWQFMCDYPELIASAAPIAAIEVSCFRSGSGPQQEVPVLFISGTGDLLVRYYNEITALSVPYTLVNVMYDYGIVTQDADQYTYSATGDLVVDAAGRINTAAVDADFTVVDGSADAGFLWTRYTSASGIAVEHLRHDNGHVYPDNPDSELFPEEPSVWFSVGEALFDFFVRNPKRQPQTVQASSGQ